MATNSGSGFYSPEINEAAIEIDQAVCALRDDLRLVVMVMYTHTSTIEQKAKRCSMSERTFWRNLHQVHVQVMEWLNDAHERADVARNNLQRSA